MFKNIGKIFKNRKNMLSRSQDKTDQIKEQLHSFLENKFGTALKGLSLKINYNPKDRSLIIISDSKILANEISLTLVELNNFLKEKNISLSRIQIK